MGRWTKEVRDRYDNDVFFGASVAGPAEPAVSEAAFYAGRPRPAAEVPIATRAAATPMRFAIVVFLVGWSGILFQASFLQQVVIGAPVFEELAKVGAPLVVVAMLRIRPIWLRVPLAWASGAAFGVMEHYVTYASEDLVSYGQRIAFHAVSPGLSMIVYSALEDLPDVRARWASTAIPTLFHWANNFLAVVLGYGSLLLAFPDAIPLAVSGFLTSGMVVLTLSGILFWSRFRDLVRRALAAAIPRVAGDPQAAGVAEPRRE